MQEKKIYRPLEDLSMVIHREAEKKGWWEGVRSLPEIIALCHSELSEALEEFRNDKPLLYYKDVKTGEIISQEEALKLKKEGLFEIARYKPEGISVEMIDCIIRILDWCGYEWVEVDEIIKQKMDFNATRPHRHGGKAI